MKISYPARVACTQWSPADHSLEPPSRPIPKKSCSKNPIPTIAPQCATGLTKPSQAPKPPAACHRQPAPASQWLKHLLIRLGRFLTAEHQRLTDKQPLTPNPVKERQSSPPWRVQHGSSPRDYPPYSVFFFSHHYPSSPRLCQSCHPPPPLCAAIPFHPNLARPRLSGRTKGISSHFVTGCLDAAAEEVFIWRSNNKWWRVPTMPHPPTLATPTGPLNSTACHSQGQPDFS